MQISSWPHEVESGGWYLKQVHTIEDNVLRIEAREEKGISTLKKKKRGED